MNPAPAFSMHERPSEGRSRNLAGATLNHLFPAGAAAARVPFIAGPSGCGAELEQLAQALRRKGGRTAGYTRNIAWSGTPRGERGRGPLGFSLLPLDAQAEVLLFEVDEVLAGVIGLPVDRVDLLLANKRAKAPQPDARPVVQSEATKSMECQGCAACLQARPVPARER